jgi:pimeloyl-ACP methyl ester carboxylesterase
MLYIDCRGAGSPTIVLEAGSGSDSAAWSAVHDQLAEATRTCTYDRAGRGRSDSRGVHTLADAAVDLRALLDAAGEPGPYVVVGHSLGGAYARVFASTHRADVVAVVLVDSFDPDLQDDWIHPLLGPLRDEYERSLDGLRAHVTRVDTLDWAASEAQLRSSSIEGLPLMAIVAPRREPRLDEATNERIRVAFIESHESLSPGNLDYIVAWGAGHNVQVDRPDLVVDSIRRLLGAAILR